MKILSQPKFALCKCELCGTVYQVEDGDPIVVRYHDGYRGPENVTFFGECPKCGSTRTRLTVIEDKEYQAFQELCVNPIMETLAYTSEVERKNGYGST